ncbi:MAG: zf-HC2 domain-containing protein [Gemmatimonadaceae bacterium]|nr:zf-HC2 domain-containing protein [Gemmatimonadaceae bacterium]
MTPTDAGLDTVVAGLRCRDVLDDLSDFLDGALPESRVSAIHQHLAGCDRCARFGGEVSRAITALRAEMAMPLPVEASRAERLKHSLRRAQVG